MSHYIKLASQAALPTRHDTAPSNAPSNRASPVNEAAQHRSYAFVPIKDDRFTTERSWYKSLNTEVREELSGGGGGGRGGRGDRVQVS